jgi:hypothetical protein
MSIKPLRRNPSAQDRAAQRFLWAWQPCLCDVGLVAGVCRCDAVGRAMQNNRPARTAAPGQEHEGAQAGAGRVVLVSGPFPRGGHSPARVVGWQTSDLIDTQRREAKECRLPHAVSAHPLPDKPGRWLSRYLDKRWHRRRGVRRYSFRTSKRSPGSRERGQLRTMPLATDGVRSSCCPFFGNPVDRHQSPNALQGLVVIG